jgi:hypothetical protein
MLVPVEDRLALGGRRQDWSARRFTQAAERSIGSWHTDARAWSPRGVFASPGMADSILNH